MIKKLADKHYYNEELCSYLNISNCIKYYKKDIFEKFKIKNIKNNYEYNNYKNYVIFDIEFIQIYNKLTGNEMFERANFIKKSYFFKLLDYFKLNIDVPDIDNNNIFSFNDKGFELNKSLVYEI